MIVANGLGIHPEEREKSYIRKSELLYIISTYVGTAVPMVLFTIDFVASSVENNFSMTMDFSSIIMKFWR